MDFGRWIAQHGSLPQADPFRSFVEGQPFLNVPWLGQLLGYEAFRWAGLEGLVLGHALLVAVAAAILMLAVCGRGVSAAWAATAAAAAYLLAIPITGTIRPQLFGMVGFAATLWAVGPAALRQGRPGGGWCRCSHCGPTCTALSRWGWWPLAVGPWD